MDIHAACYARKHHNYATTPTFGPYNLWACRDCKTIVSGGKSLSAPTDYIDEYKVYNYQRCPKEGGHKLWKERDGLWVCTYCAVTWHTEESPAAIPVSAEKPKVIEPVVTPAVAEKPKVIEPVATPAKVDNHYICYGRGRHTSAMTVTRDGWEEWWCQTCDMRVNKIYSSDTISGADRQRFAICEKRGAHKVDKTGRTDFWVCRTCGVNWRSQEEPDGCISRPAVKEPVTDPVSTDKPVAKPIAEPVAAPQACANCLAHTIMPNVCCHEGCNDSHGLMCCSVCEARWHDGGGVQCYTDEHRDGHYRCVPCYMQEQHAKAHKLSEKVEHLSSQLTDALDTLRVPGYCCPACGDTSYARRMNLKPPQFACTAPGCGQIWHVCPTVPGMILCEVIGHNLACTACASKANPETKPETESDSELESESESEYITCPLCGSDDEIRDCECKYAGDCNHYRCEACNLTWHDCPDLEAGETPVMRKGAPLDSHIACDRCGKGRRWMSRLRVEQHRAGKRAQKH